MFSRSSTIATTGQSSVASIIIRALQLLLAVVVLGTDGYAINSYHSYSVDTHFSWGESAVLTYGVPASWGFLMFCAAWTFVAVILHFLFWNKPAGRSLPAWMVVAVELIAVLSWLAGFVAVAVEIGTDASPGGRKYCGSIIGATVAGGLESLLFTITFAGTSAAVIIIGIRHKRRSRTTHQEPNLHSLQAEGVKQSNGSYNLEV